MLHLLQHGSFHIAGAVVLLPELRQMDEGDRFDDNVIGFHDLPKPVLIEIIIENMAFVYIAFAFFGKQFSQLIADRQGQGL